MFVFAQFALHIRQGFPFMAHLHALRWIKRRREGGREGLQPAGASLLLRYRRRESGGGAAASLGFALWWSVTAALVRSRFPPRVALPQPRHDAGSIIAHRYVLRRPKPVLQIHSMLCKSVRERSYKMQNDWTGEAVDVTSRFFLLIIFFFSFQLSP